jgi:lysophospholipase L1-like esterase
VELVSRILTTFGDSWTVGADLDHPVKENYGAILAQKLDFKHEDFSQNSTGVPHLLIQFRSFIEKNHLELHADSTEQYHAVFFISAMERGIYFDQDGIPKEMIPSNDKFRNYYNDLYTDHLGTFNVNNTLLSLQNLCRLYGIKDYYMFGWQTVTLWPEIDRLRFYDRGRSNILNMFAGDYHSTIYDLILNPNPYMILNNGHPNAAGHQKIADMLAVLIEKNLC